MKTLPVKWQALEETEGRLEVSVCARTAAKFTGPQKRGTHFGQMLKPKENPFQEEVTFLDEDGVQRTGRVTDYATFLELFCPVLFDEPDEKPSGESQTKTDEKPSGEPDGSAWVHNGNTWVWVSAQERKRGIGRLYSPRVPMPRVPLWVPKFVRPKVPLSSIMDGLDIPDDAPVAVAKRMDESPKKEATKTGSVPIPVEFPLSRLANARAEAVFLGQHPSLVLREPQTVSLSKRRVHTLSSLTDGIHHADELRAYYQEMVHRRESTYQSRLRGELAKKASKAVAAASQQFRPKSRDPILDASEVFGASIGNTNSLLSLDDPFFSGTTMSDSWQSVSSTPSHTRRPKLASRGAMCMSATSASFASNDSAVGAAINVFPSPQLIWQEDVMLGRPLTAVGGQNALHCATSVAKQLGHRQAVWTAALRRPDSLPSLPNPTYSEARRTGLVRARPLTSDMPKPKPSFASIYKNLPRTMEELNREKTMANASWVDELLSKSASKVSA